MTLLVISVAAILVLGTLWIYLTQRPRRVRRRWSWRRVYRRTLDFLVVDYSGERLLILLLFCPFLPQLSGTGRSLVGWSISAAVALILALIALLRAGKWMTRASRPVDEVRQRFEDRVLSDEYRSTVKKKERN